MPESLREKALALPLKPGVYIMRDASGEVIYVGKAKALKNRVSSYFHGSHNAKTEAMISKIADFSVIIADSEFEALVLENSLIKHHAPKYNILLKDDKGYPFIRLDVKSDYPRFTIASKRENDGAEYFGPFGGRSTTKTAIDAICKSLKLPTCGKKFPRDIGKERPCLNYHMGVCDAYCNQKATQEDYRRAIERAVMILRGRSRELVDELTEQMERAAEELRFEEAARLRDTISSITSLETRQHVLMKGSSDTDAIGFFTGQVKSCFTVLHYIQGQLLGKDAELLEDPLGDGLEGLSVLVRQFYSNRENIPKNILMPEDTGDLEELARFLSDQSGHTVSVTVPQRGINRDFINAAAVNAREETERLTTTEERISKTARWLMEALGLSAPPVRVESFDISNTGADDIVASMVVFDHGRPLKRAYKKFKMKTIIGTDDYGSMREAVGRRFSRFAGGDPGFSQLPDLLLIDGGAAHAAAAKEAMERTGVSVPVFGMVKDDRHRTRALVTPEGEEIGISGFPAVFAFIGTIQEETHRFAIEFHRSLRSKRVSRSKLDGIPGVGEKRKAELLKYFKSIKTIERADVAELSKVVPKPTAQAIYSHFHKKSGE
ncbi:MAG: excinuclease ABC subunit UvrC [Oscillospiraceae bacterium]